MIDVTVIRNSPDIMENALRARGMDANLVAQFAALDSTWRAATVETDAARAKLNEASRERDIAAGRALKSKIKKMEEESARLAAERDDLLNRFPNIPASDVPSGISESENAVLRTVGAAQKGAEDYLSFAERTGLIDIARASKVAGSRFGFLMREAALLEFALVQFSFDTLVREGFIPVVPPVMVKPEHFRGMGRLAGAQAAERYFVESDNLYLAGSAEHTIGPMHADEILEEKNLPRRYVGFSTCFRREAGSYGTDTKGILRTHQFDKVEMFSFTKPEQSADEHQFLLSLQEKMMAEIGLPYRVVEMCAGELGFTDAKQYDIETWIPSENRYRETHSCSNTTDFQARGVNIKYKPTAGGERRAAQFVHMLNATGFAVGRTIIAILENFQSKDGSVRVPKALHKYIGFKKIG